MFLCDPYWKFTFQGRIHSLQEGAEEPEVEGDADAAVLSLGTKKKKKSKKVGRKTV